MSTFRSGEWRLISTTRVDLGYDANRTESPFTSAHGVGVEGCTNVTLGDHSGYEVGGNDTSLRMSSEEDGVGSTEIVDPGRIRQVGFVQATRVSRDIKQH